MEVNLQKELFSNAYLQAVTAVAGYSLYKPFVDDDSVDWGIAAKGREGRIRSPRLELQLKSTSRNVLGSNSINYPLKLKNYNDLRMADFAIPRILVIVLIPDNLVDWLHQSESELCMRYCGYWKSLRGMSETANAKTVTVTIPRNNQFTVSAIQSIMQQIGQGSQP